MASEREMTYEEFRDLFKMAQELHRYPTKERRCQIAQKIMDMVEDHVGQIRLED